jgi:hypothetical protein
MLGGYVVQWEHTASGAQGIRPSKDNKNTPDWFKKRSDALDEVAHLNVRAHAYTYRAIPALGKKLVGPYKKDKGTP